MINIKLMIFVLMSLSMKWRSNGQFAAPENVRACVTYQENRTLLNVRWQDAVNTGSSKARHIIFYSSSSSNFNENAFQPVERSANNITGINIPNDLNGQQLQISVAFEIFDQVVSNVSEPTQLGVSPIYLASYEAFNITGIHATLRLRFQLACGLEDEVMCAVNISAGRNSNNINFPAFSQTHKIAKDADRSNLFDSMEVFLNFPNITMGIDYFVHAQLLNSEGILIGPEQQRTINIPHSVSIIPTFAPSTSSSEIVSTSVTPTSTQPGTVTDLTARTTATMTNQIQTTPTSSSVGVATDADDSSSVAVAIGVSVGCFILMALSITLCIAIVMIKRNDKQKKKKPSSNSSDDYSVPDKSIVYANRLSCSSTSVFQSSTTDLIQACSERHPSKNHDYSLPPDTNYILYEESPQVPQNNSIPSHYETAKNQNSQQMEPFLLNGHYEMSNTVMFDAAVLESSTTVTDYSELVHNSHQNGNDIPPIPMGGYDYDQLDQSVSNQDTAGPHYYDPVANNTSQQQQQIKQSDGYTELQNSTTNHNKNRPYQVLTNSNVHPRSVVHQYEDVDNDTGDYSEPFKGKKLPRHDYDLVAGDAIPPPKRPFVREYSEPRDTLNIFIN